MKRAEEGTQVFAEQALDGIEFSVGGGKVRRKVALKVLR
jgi:hypothetical protein